MLASQRDLFEMPRDICYLNSASYSPLPLLHKKPSYPAKSGYPVRRGFSV